MIAIIPARGGSKGLPGKNIKLLNGKPLIAYTIEAALKSKYIDKVFVSTDDEEIAKIAKEYGAWVPFLRPSELATDTSQAKDTYLYVMNRLEKEYGYDKRKFMVLLPTAPLRNEKHIDEACELFKERKAETLVSMKQAPCPPSWFFEETNGKVINANLGSGSAINNRQENKEYYIPNGAIYILDYDLLNEKGTYYSENTIAYKMSEKESIDIDYEFDFLLTEYIFMDDKRND